MKPLIAEGSGSGDAVQKGPAPSKEAGTADRKLRRQAAAGRADSRERRCRADTETRPTPYLPQICPNTPAQAA